jgi:hypothetical protein
MYLFRHQQTEQAKLILDKSFSSLTSTDRRRISSKKFLSFLSAFSDVEMINKFGQLEFKYGDKERAKTLYEKLLSSYPKRTDIWSIYIDMLIKYVPEPLIAARYLINRVVNFISLYFIDQYLIEYFH